MRKESPGHVITTLYDVIAAMQDVTTPDEDALVVSLVMHWLRTRQILAYRVNLPSSPARDTTHP